MYAASKVFVCAMIFLASTVCVGAITYMSHMEFYYAAPPMKERLGTVTELSETYFRYYHYLSWAIVVMVAVSGLFVALRKEARSDGIALFAAYALLTTTVFAMLAMLAFYLCNRGLLA